MSTKDFKTEQLKQERVQQAYALKEELVKQALRAQQIYGAYEILLNAYKREAVLEVWVKAKGHKTFKHLSSYPFCVNSGILGPKTREGDLQIPEGFYKLHVFNPKSIYHLSLGINYPNALDLALNAENPGSDIYIHGKCSSKGCISIDTAIEDLYILAVEARQAGQEDIPVQIYPFKMEVDLMEEAIQKYPQHEAFWRSLQQAYLRFQSNKRNFKVLIKNGTYVLVKPKRLQ